MYQFDWFDRDAFEEESRTSPSVRSRLIGDEVSFTMLLHWQEHCLECGPPLCYSTCPLYVRRLDRKCARFEYGIARREDVDGLLGYGADIKFRRWGKLEASLHPKPVTVAVHRAFGHGDKAATGIVNAAAGLLQPVEPNRRLNGALSLYRDKLLGIVANDVKPLDYDEFVIECFLVGSNTARLIIEVISEGSARFRQAVDLVPGDNFNTISASSMIRDVNWSQAHITIYPEDDAEIRLIFSWLDFVRYKARPGASAQKSLAPADKVKCVAWDLDNTVWNGTLVESEPESLHLREGVIDAMHEFDRRGILQTVVSKNDHDQVWPVLKRLSIDHFFLYPAINWGAKSENLKQIAQHLNIGIDTLALIDDSPFERMQVSSALPMVRAFPETGLSALLRRPELDLPITEMSSVRRLSYLTEIKRIEAHQVFPGDYLSFLKGCDMRLRIFEPRSDTEIDRCRELVQRSNQLNLSGRSFDTDSFSELLRTGGILCVALDCKDKFGSYGIVGFASIDEREPLPRLTDFVMSCRVAQKRVEHAFFQWLTAREHSREASKLIAELVVSRKNGPLAAVFDDLCFLKVGEAGNRITYELACSSDDNSNVIVKVEADL